jgi:pyrimidine operon attenuation protein/uracil phosphoribosyltransferase
MEEASAVNTRRVQILDGPEMDRTVARMAAEVFERDAGELALVGVHTRGVPIARRLASRLGVLSGTTVEVGSLDITLYRDDVGPWRPAHLQPVLQDTQLPFAIDGCTLCLVDDVLFTGRTVRSALNTLMDYGRPKGVRLVVLVDRGHRELPIQADVVGKKVPTALDEDVQVRLREIDGVDGVWIQRGEADGG